MEVLLTELGKMRFLVNDDHYRLRVVNPCGSLLLSADWQRALRSVGFFAHTATMIHEVESLELLSFAAFRRFFIRENGGSPSSRQARSESQCECKNVGPS